jgi:Asp-tRNA(Asn)/Glu-tRNA(Gln) amidotransferase A subunit family amidase
MNQSEIDLCFITATKAIEKFRSKALSPVQLLDQLIARIEDVNESLNAFTVTYFDHARDQAIKAEDLYRSGQGLRPLEGIPIVIKDYHDVEGELTTYGSRMFEHHISDKSAPTVQRLLEAGAILLARSTTSTHQCLES